MYPCVRRLTLGFVILVLGMLTVPSGAAQTLTAPSALTIHPGDASVPLTVTLGPGTANTAFSVVLTGLPSGVTTAPLTMMPGSTATLLLSASRSAGIELFPALTPIDPNAVTVSAAVLAFQGSVQAQAPLALTISLTNPTFAPAPQAINLPIVTINTNGVGINDKVTDVPGTITIQSADGQTTYLPSSSLPDNTATFHLHGNTTSVMPKRPYKVKLNTGADLLAAMGLQCGYVNSSGVPTCDKSKSFVLLANYDDKTLLRDWAASALANSIPAVSPYLAYPPGAPTPTNNSTFTWWAPHSLFVELFLNGAYQGNYQLIEEVKIDTHRINISSIGNNTVSGKALTGGYLGEIDGLLGEDFDFTSAQGVGIGLSDPDYSPEVPEQTQYFQDVVQTAENALFASDYTDPKLGWRANFDETTAINFYIVNDLMGNVDGGAFFGSDYFYKNENDPLLYMGPVWDFDISSGNISYQPISNPTVPWMQTKAVWYRQWFTDPGFHADVVKQWNALKNNGVFSQWLTSIAGEAATLQQSQANNFNRWPMQGVLVWPNPQAGGSYAAELSYMTQWLTLRMAYLDGVFNNKAATTTVLAPPSAVLRTGTPSSFTASVTGQASSGPVPTGTVSLFGNSILLGTATVNSAGIATVSVQNIPSGAEQIQAVYSGDSVYALSASSSTPISVSAPLIPTAVNLQASTGDALPGSPVVLTAAVAATQGTMVPTGHFTFTSAGTVLGSQAVSAIGVASLTATTLPVGLNQVQALYSGDGINQAATSNSVGVTMEYPMAASPLFSVPGGTFNTPQTLTLADANSGATIYYTSDGSTPTTASTVYRGPLTVALSGTIQAIAGGLGFRTSPIVSAAFVIVPTFTLSVTPSNISTTSSQPVNISALLTPLYGFTQPIAMGCSAPSINAVCTFSPASITPGGVAPVTSKITIRFPALATAEVRAGRTRTPGRWPGGVISLAALLVIFVAPCLRRHCGRILLAVTITLLCIGGLNGCGDSPLAGTHFETVTVTASSGQISVSQKVYVAVVPSL